MNSTCIFTQKAITTTVRNGKLQSVQRNSLVGQQLFRFEGNCLIYVSEEIEIVDLREIQTMRICFIQMIVSFHHFFGKIVELMELAPDLFAEDPGFNP